MSMYGEIDGATWHSANPFYDLQYDYLRKMNIGFSQGNFDLTFTFFKELFDLVSPYIDKVRYEEINSFIKEIDSKLIELHQGVITKQKKSYIDRLKFGLISKVRDKKLILIKELKKENMLLPYAVKDTRSIAQRNNK